MRFFEYKAKEVLKKYGISVPNGEIATSLAEAEEIASRLGFPVVLKAQVPVGGRGRAGGVVKGTSREEVRALFGRLIGSEIGGFQVSKVLVEKEARVKRELYLSITIDRREKKPVMLASSEGGMEIEDIVKKRPETLVKRYIDPLIGLKDYECRRVGMKIGIGKELLPKWTDLAKRLYNVFVDYDAELVEINPLALTEEGELMALDAKMIVDDNAIWRHPELEIERERGELTRWETVAREKGFSFVELDGDIGVIGNGAGLTMATMDTIFHYGGRPANFLDVGGGARREVVAEAVSLLLRLPKVKVILVNIFGGITRCDEVALGIIEALKRGDQRKPIVVKLRGTNDEQGRRLLEGEGIRTFLTTDEAAATAVNMSRNLSGG